YPNGTNNDQINDSMAPNTFPFADDRYTYDLLGNRLTDQRQTPGFTWQYNANNELLHSGFATYSYNENGSTTAKKDPTTGQPIQSYAYNSEERMSEVRDAAGNLVAEYYYDPFGRRLWKTLYLGAEGHPGGEQPVKEYLAYSDEGYAAEAVASIGAAPAPNVVKLSLFAPGRLWSTDPVLQKRGDSMDYLQVDNLGTLHGASESGASALRQKRIAVFGEAIGDVVSFFRLPGQYFDKEVAHAYSFTRSYDPKLGRFMEFDQAWPDSNEHYYSYSRAQPVKRLDPDGRASVGPCCGAARMMGAGFEGWPYDREDRGMVVCCFGRAVPCSNVDSTRYSDAFVSAIIDSCIEDHEDAHIPSVECTGCGIARGYFKAGTDTNSNECAAYAKQLRCLRMRKLTCSTPECSSQVDGEIRRIERYDRPRYGCQ
ncbi:RHS repeat domain-containing protein, partial [Pseudomarimonas arenosa]